MTAIEATNRGLADTPWAMLTSSPRIEEIDLDEWEAQQGGAVLLDVREPEEYAQGHVPGAINIPQAELASRLQEIPRHRSVITICQGGVRSLRAAQFLKQVGFEQVVSVAGGTQAWRQAGKALALGTIRFDGTRIVETEWAHAGASTAMLEPDRSPSVPGTR